MENEERKHKQYINKDLIKKGLIYTGSTVGAFAIGFGGAYAGGALVFREWKNDLPDIVEAKNNMNQSGSETQIAWNDDARFVFPASGTLKVNVHISDEKLTDDVKKALEDSVDEINKVLEMINPKYNLKIDYNPSIFDNLYCFNLYEESLDLVESSKARAIATTQTKTMRKTNNGLGKYVVDVNVDLDWLREKYGTSDEFYLCLRNALTHEIAGHGIAGLSDAYLLDNYPYQTLMDSEYDGGMLFSKSDLMMLFSKYRNDNNYDEWEEQIDAYLANQEWYLKLQEQVGYLKENFYNEYVIKNGLEEYIKPEDIKFENIGKFGDFYLRSSIKYMLPNEEDSSKMQNEMVYYIGKTSDERFAETLAVGSVYDGSFVYISENGGLYNINGVQCTASGEFLVQVGDNTVVMTKLSEDENGNCEFNFSTRDLISESDYNNGIRGIINFNEEEDIDKKAVSSAMFKMLLGFRFSSKNININDITAINGDFEFKDNGTGDTYVLTESGVAKTTMFGDVEDYKIKFIDGKILCSNGMLLVSTSEGIRALDIEFLQGEGYNSSSIDISYETSDGVAIKESQTNSKGN